MWIRVRYFDISKRPELPSGYRFLGLMVLVSAISTGCVVTDKIEFEEPMNNPPIVLSRDPAENVFDWGNVDEHTFSVVVWDPDVEEIQDVPLQGKLIVNSDKTGIVIKRTCLRGSPEPDEDGKISFPVSCTHAGINTVPSGSLVEYTVVISDLGFIGAELEPRSGANVVEETWVVRMP